MGLVTIPNTWNNSDILYDTALEANFSVLANEFNGNIDDANVKANAGIAQSKISGLVSALAGKADTTGATFTGSVIVSTTTGTLRVPVMTTTQRLALSASNGDIVYDSTLAALYAYEGGSWVAVTPSGAVADASAVTKGKVRLSAAPISATDPIAVGDNDPRLITPESGVALSTANPIIDQNSTASNVYNIDVSYTPSDDTATAFGTGDRFALIQTVTVDRDRIDALVVKAGANTGSPVDDIEFRLYLADSNDRPTGAQIGSTKTVAAASWVASAINNVTGLSGWTSLTPGLKYCVRINGSGATPDESNYRTVRTLASGTYTGGKLMKQGGGNSHCISLDGVDDYLSRADTATTRVADGWTVEFKVKIAAVDKPSGGNNKPLIVRHDGSHGFIIAIADTGAVHFYGDSINNIGNATTDICDGSYHHVAVVFTDSGDSNNTSIYIDGVREFNAGADSVTGSAGIALGIGRDISGVYVPNTVYTKAKFDDIRIWSDARSSAEISANMDLELGGSEANLNAYWKLNNVLTDSTANGNTLTNNGSAAFATDPAFTYTPTFEADGSADMYIQTKFSVASKVARLDASGYLPTGALQYAAPVGAILPYAGASAPTGWLLADGSAVSRTTYADLYALIADAYGPGDGSTTFNLPNLKNRVPVGVDTTVKTVLEDCEDAWNESVAANVTSTLDTSDFKAGSGSVSLAVAAAVAANTILATEAIGSVNLYGQSSVRLWIKSTVATNAGDLQLLLDDTGSCASPLETINIPALVANTWTRITLPLANAGTDAAIVSIGLKYVTDLGACTIHLDDIAFGENFEVGADGGKKTHTLLAPELAAHTHPTGSGQSTSNGGVIYNGSNNSGALATGSNTPADRAHNNMQPFLTLNYIIRY